MNNEWLHFEVAIIESFQSLEKIPIWSVSSHTQEVATDA